MATRKLNHRCSICNTVSSREIETNFQESSDRPFVPDPKNKDQFICQSCSDEINEVLHYWQVDDFRKQIREDGELPILEDE